MALYIIERSFAEKLEFVPEGVKALEAINEAAGVSWMLSFLSADKKKTYCLYQADDPSALIEAAQKAGIPADKIVEVEQIDPKAALGTA